MSTENDLIQIWQAIVRAGGMNAYTDEQLRERGYLPEKRETDGMSKRQLKQYKKQLKEESAERKRIKKEVWQAYRANHIVHLGEGIYWNDADDFDKWDLEEAEARAAENDLPPLDKPKQLAEALGLSISRLRWLAYHRDAATRIHYRRFTIAKGDGSRRHIWAPLPELKRVQRWILRNIAEKLPVHGAAHGFLPARSVLSNAAVHTGASLIVKADVRNFFPTITLRRVKGIFRKAGYREQIATLLALLCTEAPREIVEHKGKEYYVSLGPRCLPQGAPTSPALSNTLCLKTDRRLSGLARKNGWRYTRYADDLTFSFPEKSKKEADISRLIGTVRMILEEEGFAMHPGKTRILRSGSRQKITGLVVNDDRTPRVPRQMKRNLRAAIHNLKQGKGLKEGESMESLKGYAAYIQMTEPELGKKLGEELKEVFSRQGIS